MRDGKGVQNYGIRLIKIKKKRIHNIYFVLELAHNLMSASQLIEMGCDGFFWQCPMFY